MSIRTRSLSRGAGKLKIRETSLHCHQRVHFQRQNLPHILGMEKVSSLIPVNPHSSQVITQQVEERVARQKAERIRNPVRLVRRVVVIRLISLSQLANRLCSLIIRSRPNPQGNSIKRMRRVLLQNKSMVNTMRLCATGTNLDIMRKTSLSQSQNVSETILYYNSTPCMTAHPALMQVSRTRIAACNDLAISLSCSNLGLLPRISGNQN
jgi:hypothetical protein